MNIPQQIRSLPYNFPAWLKEKRKSLNLTQEALAGFLDCSVSTIQKYENGSRTPDLEVYDRIIEISENIVSGTETIRSLIQDLDRAVIGGAAGNDHWIREFWENFTNSFFADELKDYLSSNDLATDLTWGQDLEKQEICKAVNETFFGGEALIVCDEDGVLKCKDAIAAAAIIYELDPYTKLPYEKTSTTSDEYNDIYAYAKATIFLALTEYTPEYKPENVVYYTYKVLSPLRKELIKTFENALSDMINIHSFENVVEAGCPENPPTTFIYHAIGETIAKGYFHTWDLYTKSPGR